MEAKNVTIDPEEVAKFEKLANKWWDINGEFGVLHKFNPVRVSYLKNKIENLLLTNNKKKFSDLKILDIGCGGGLLSEPFARLGANMTSIDAVEKNIKTAMTHASQSNLKINYLHSTVENLPINKKFDVIFNMEVIEHVAEPEVFINKAANLLKKDGLMFIATINRTLKSLICAKFGAEYILKWLPIGTHDWNKFLKPSEINQLLKNSDLSLKDKIGVEYHIFGNKWELSQDLSQNYMMLYQKE